MSRRLIPRPWLRWGRARPLASISLLVAALAAGTSISPRAAAEPRPGFALSRFDPTFAGDRLFGVPSPGAFGPSTLHGMLVLDYAHDPLVMRDEATGKKTASVVGHQVLVHLNVTYALFRRLAVNIDLPVVFNQGDTLPANAVLPSPSTAGVGDLRLGARAGLYGEADDPFQVGLAGVLWVPTGTRSAFAGDGLPRGMPQLVLGGVTPYFVWSAAMGPELRAPQPVGAIMQGPAFRWSTGLGFLPGDGSFQIGPEVHGAVDLLRPARTSTDVEAMMGARHRFARDLQVGFAAAVGLAHGLGTPDFRTVLTFAYTPQILPEKPAIADRDGDLIADADDACPDEPGQTSDEPANHGCPPVADRDLDKIPDADDACPDQAGVADVVPKINGCPPDRDNDEIPDAEDACPDQIGVRDPDAKKNGCPALVDHDGDQIPDIADACPDVAGQANADPKRHGCPGDTDGDGIFDDKDACPREKGAPDPDPAKNGCPKDVRVTEGQIVILQQVEFDTAKATIRKVSNGLLDTVANVLKEHPEILRVEVEGHTDNTGSAEQNTALSQQRAEAVAAALIKRGIDKGRLTARGYGPTRPIMANVTSVGRQKNRRVEFRILERRAEAQGEPRPPGAASGLGPQAPPQPQAPKP